MSTEESTSGVVFNADDVEGAGATLSSLDNSFDDEFFDETGQFNVGKAAMFIISQNKALDIKLNLLKSEVDKMIENKVPDEKKESAAEKDQTPGPSTRNEEHTKTTDSLFATYEIDGNLKEVWLPNSFQFVLRSTSNQQAMVTAILRHYHDILFLRGCTVSGSSRKRNSDGSNVAALPTETVLITTAIVKKLLPSPFLKNAEEKDMLLPQYQNAIVEDDKSIKNNIKKTLSYFYHSYDENGILRDKNANKTP